MKIIKIASLIFVFMLSSCSSIGAPTPTTTIQPSTETVIASPSPMPTVTAIPSATKKVEVDQPEGCIELTPTTFDPSKIDPYFLPMSYLLEQKTWENIDINNVDLKSITLHSYSPNKKYSLASISTKDGKSYYYIFITPDKVSKINLPISDDWIVFHPWSDNEHMVFYTLEQGEYLNSWNPFTGELKSVQLNLPNAEEMYFSPAKYIVYVHVNPTLDKVFYSGADGRLILWDVVNKKEIASLPKSMQEGDSAVAFLPVFNELSPDGNKLITPWPTWNYGSNPPANELYVFDTDGNINQLTELNKKYSFASADEPVWSPDGSQIGFWLKIGDGNPNPLKLHQWLAIFDTTTKETKVYCLANGVPDRYASRVDWSPSGQQLGVDIDLPNGDHSSILVDLIHQTKSVVDWSTISK